jgi:hypothetical protein
MKISKDGLEKLIKEELAAELSERDLDEVSLNPFKGITTPGKTLQRSYSQGQRTGSNWRAKLGKFFGLDSPSDEPAPTTTPSTSSADKTLPISASEMKIIQQVGKSSQNSDVFKIVDREIRNLGVAQKNPQAIPIIKAFRATLFPAVQQLYKRANIDIAESIMDEQEKLSSYDRGRLKAKLRQGAGAMAYFKPRGRRGEKPPLLLQVLEKKLKYHLIDRVSENQLKRAIVTVSQGMKDEDAKALAQGFFNDAPRRLKTYKENAHVFVEEILRLAAAALEKAAAENAAPQRQLPESEETDLQEAIANDRWKVLSGIQ